MESFLAVANMRLQGVPVSVFAAEDAVARAVP